MLTLIDRCFMAIGDYHPQHTRTQQKQLDYLRWLEPRETLSSLNDFGFECKDCRVNKDFHAACTGIMFINCHIGHRTWIHNYGRRSSLQPRAW